MKESLCGSNISWEWMNDITLTYIRGLGVEIINIYCIKIILECEVWNGKSLPPKS